MKLRISALLITALSLIALPGAQAHTSVVATIPEYKSTLAEMPATISIQFTDELMVLGKSKVNSIVISDPSNQIIPGLKISVNGSTLLTQIPSADYLEGTYIVSYRVVSADGHPVSGSYELYLDHPSDSKNITAIHAEEHSFFHLHRTHFYQAGAVLIVIILWWGYRRFTREQSA
jgi:methionine-rich copper-binding protein CopC